ncbi:hypothetical protein KCP73_21730 [Salmonella enterica subsp. enterica]|nr:hypothetical protein KCP73_21730 [Salmonella enterica subsp. enterica]
MTHPPAGTTREDVINRFELLQTLAYAGWERKAFIFRPARGKITSYLDEDSQRYCQSPLMMPGTIP